MKEVWKPLEIYNGEYAVSSHGRVMSLKYGKKRILKPAVNPRGYQMVAIYFGKRYQKFVHRLVCIGFGMLKDGFQINHIDGNKLNNNLKNLEACTGSYNMKHSYKMGLNQQAKINMEIANKIRKDVLDGKTQLFVSRKYKISKSHVSNIVNNKHWVMEITNAH